MLLEARRVSAQGWEERDVAYWRKANAIHRWFVEHVQGGHDECGSTPVTREQLEQLIDVCQRVLDWQHLAVDLLPTSDAGAFWGRQDYGERYFDHVANTIQQLNRALADCKEPDWQFVYSSSW